jgi:hypothetical protein
MRCTLSASQPAPPARVHAVRPERGAPAPSAAAACEALWNVSRARALAHPWLRALVAQVCALGPPCLAGAEPSRDKMRTAPPAHSLPDYRPPALLPNPRPAHPLPPPPPPPPCPRQYPRRSACWSRQWSWHWRISRRWRSRSAGREHAAAPGARPPCAPPAAEVGAILRHRACVTSLWPTKSGCAQCRGGAPCCARARS